MVSRLRGRSRRVDHFEKYKEKLVSRFAGASLNPRGKNLVSRRDRAKAMRSLKKEYELTRSQMGAIGAGDMKAPWENE